MSLGTALAAFFTAVFQHSTLQLFLSNFNQAAAKFPVGLNLSGFAGQSRARLLKCPRPYLLSLQWLAWITAEPLECTDF